MNTNNITYGLSDYQIKQAHNKLVRNKEFMYSNGVHIDNKIVPFADFVANSYMNADRYIAEIQHRAWSIQDYAISRDLKNIFITLTLPSVWHKMKTFKQKLINNPLFGGRKYLIHKKIKNPINGKKYKILNCEGSFKIPFREPDIDFSNTIDYYTPRNASKELSKLLKKFFDDRSYKSIDKDDRCYFRVTEPHKDGTPHLHISLFVPASSVDGIVKSLHRLYPAPMSKIETDVKSPVHYLMKYVLKTFDDLRDDKTTTNLTLWYLYHGISRFYTSRTFVSLEVYRKLRGMYGLQELSQKYLDGHINVYTYKGTNNIAMIENEFGTIYVPKPVNWFEKMAENDIYLNGEFESIYKETVKKPIEMEIDGVKYIYCDGKYSIKRKKPLEMKDMELYLYYRTLKSDITNPHFIHTHNLVVEKGLIEGELLKHFNHADYQEAGEVF